jgi:hypothetical protein
MGNLLEMKWGTKSVEDDEKELKKLLIGNLSSGLDATISNYTMIWFYFDLDKHNKFNAKVLKARIFPGARMCVLQMPKQSKFNELLSSAMTSRSNSLELDFTSSCGLRSNHYKIVSSCCTIPQKEIAIDKANLTSHQFWRLMSSFRHISHIAFHN